MQINAESHDSTHKPVLADAEYWARRRRHNLYRIMAIVLICVWSFIGFKQGRP